MKEKLLIVTEAALENAGASPLSELDKARINGVYRTYQNLTPHLEDKYDIEFLTPFDYPGRERNILSAIFNRDTPFQAPRQNSIRLVFPSRADLAARIEKIAPDYIHVATEGPLGKAAIDYAKRRNIPRTSAFHTNWHQYLLENGFHIPLLPKTFAADAAKKLLTQFHKAAHATMAATPELRDQLSEWGLDPQKINIVSRGVDTDIFHPYGEENQGEDYVLHVGRMAPGKGVERFCELNTGGLRKVAIGTGPIADKLKTAYPETSFEGFAEGAALARKYSGAKFFVMPSDTETFGMTVIESLACGTPVVALNQGGHRPILDARPDLGIMNESLQSAFNSALYGEVQFLPSAEMAHYIAMTRSWSQEAANFSDMLQLAKGQTPG